MILDESKMNTLEHPLNYPMPASPEEIQLIAIDIILAKDRRTRRAQRNYVLMHRKAEGKLVPKINEWLDFVDKKLKAGLSRMRGQTPATMVKSIADWGEIRRYGEELIKPELMEILTEGGNAVMERRMVKKQARFDPIGIEAVNWVNTHGAELVVEITAETMQGIRDVITTGIQAGKSMPAIARELRPIVGLNSQYAGAVGKLHTSLIAEGVTAQKAAAQAERYAGRLHRRRTMTIARTESAYALTEGQRQGYAQMGVKRLMRVEAPTCCDICADYDGHVYTIAEASGILPEHPNCGGTWVAAPGERVEPLRNFYNNVTDGEIEIIQAWSDDTYLMVRKYLRAGEIERENLLARYGAKLKTDAEAMEKLFLKYKNGVSDKMLYRGLGDVPDDVYNAFKQYNTGNIAEIDTAISSWTTDAETMNKFSGGKNQIKFYLDKGRTSTLELDISSFARITEEQEVILNSHKFKITAIEEEIIPSPIPGSTAAPTRILNVFLEEPGI
ncbi:hypothetical protein ES703_76164 [subsurface metagenome]